MSRGTAALLGCLLAGALGPAAVSPEDRKPRWATCELKVDNKTPYRVLVYVDGVYWGWVNPQRAFAFRGVPAGDITVYGETQYADFTFGPKGVKCKGTAPWELSF